MKKILTLTIPVILFALTALCQGQASPAPVTPAPVVGVQTTKTADTTYSMSAFIQRTQSFGVVLAELHRAYSSGRLSIDSKGFLGADVTSPKAVAGLAEVATYNIWRDYNLMGGLAIAQTSFRINDVNANSIGLILGVSGPLDLSILFGGTSTQTNTAQVKKVTVL